MKKPSICFLLMSFACLYLASCITLGGYSPSAAEQQIYSAVLQNNLAAAENLLKNGSPPNARGVSGESLLHTAVRASNLEMVNMLLKYKADVNFPNNDDFPPLAVALKPFIVKTLIDNGANIRYVSKKKNLSPFELWCTNFSFITSESDKKQTMDILKLQNIPVKREDLEKKLWITRSDLTDIVKLYQTAGYDINTSYNPEKNTPLHIGATIDNYAVMHVLMDAGAKAGVDNIRSDDPLNIITRWNESKNTNTEYAAVVKALIKSGADIHAADADGDTPLCNAAENDNYFRVKTLMAVPGCNVNVPGEYGENALAKTNSLAIAKELVGAKINIEHQNNNGRTPLFTIVNHEIVSYLIKQGADIHHLDKFKYNILISNVLAAHGEYKVHLDAERAANKWAPKFEVLIAAGTDVNYTTDKLTALSVANRAPLERIVNVLKKAGAR